MEGYGGIEYLRRKLTLKQYRVKLRYQYYEMKNVMQEFSKVIPPELGFMNSVLGWSAKAADSLADRLVFRDFLNDNFDINEIFDMNNRDVFFDSAVLSAAISSCCFVYISQDADGFPRLQVIDGANATGVMDPITGMLLEGYAVLIRSDNGNPTSEAYFLPGVTQFYEKGRLEYSISNAAPYPLLVPIMHRPDAVRPFGHSRISRSCMSIQKAALRTIRRSEVAAEFYMTRPAWEPVFEPDAAMLSGIGDGAIKINQAVPGYFGKENLRDLTGIESGT